MIEAKVAWCCHDLTPSGTQTWATGINIADTEFVWPPVESDLIYPTATSVIEAAKQALLEKYCGLEVKWVG